MSEDESGSRGKKGRGGRPEGSGPRQAEARVIAESVGRKIGENLENSLRTTTANLVDAFKDLLNSSGTLAGREGVDPLQKVADLITEFGTRLSGLEEILERLATSGQHDAATAMRRADDLAHILEGLRSELGGKRVQEQESYRRFREIRDELIQKIDCMVPAVADHGAAVVLATLKPVLDSVARESTMAAEFVKLTEEQERHHSNLLKTIEKLQRAPLPAPDRRAMRRRAIELALVSSGDVRRHTQLQAHPAEYVVERHHIGSSVIVETMADAKMRIWVGGWGATQTATGWEPSDFTEIADRAVGLVEDFRQKLSKPKLAIVG